MPLGFIRSRSDYNKWLEAVKLTKQRKAQRNPEDPNYDPKLKPIQNVFAYANWLYHNVLSESGGIVLEEQEIDGPIKTDEQQKVFEWIHNKIFTEKTLKNISEEKKWSILEDLYVEFINKNPNLPMDKLEEFTSFQTGTSSGPNNIASLYGMGGYRDERPIGPIVYGANQVGLNNPMVNNKLDDDPAIVVIPDKKSKYNPNEFVLDQSGNVVDDIEQSKKSTEIKKNVESEEDYSGDILSLLQDIGYTVDQLENMDEEELTNAVKKSIKELKKQQEVEKIKESVTKNKNIFEKLLESFVVEDDECLDESLSLTASARNLLANKFKMGKAVKKVNDKYVLSQDDISKLIRAQGYTFSKKYNKWIRKSSPTFWGRKILSTKFQDKLATQKDEDGKYILNQDDINKKMNDNGYIWDSKKRLWIKKPEDKMELPVIQKTQINKTEDEPKQIINKPESSSPEEIIQEPKIKLDDLEDDVIDDEEYEEELNPLKNPDILAKMKYMQGRLILGIITSDQTLTDFNKNESNTWIPTIKDEDITERLSKLGFEWDAVKKLWLDQSLTIPKQIFDIEEDKKSIIARSLLASLGKVKNIKTNASGKPTVDKEKLDVKMDIEGFIWNSKTQNWKYFGEDDEEIEENFDPLNESVLEEVRQPIKTEKIKEPKRKYDIVDVGEWQARLLMRSLQYAWYRKASKIDKSKADQIWNSDMKDGLDGDAMSPNMDISLVENWLENNGNYVFNNDKNQPMWVDKNEPNKMPSILSSVGINSEQEYIARGILAASKKPEYVQIRATSPDKPRMRISDDKVNMRMESNNLTWNKDWGWIVNDGSDVASKNELNIQKWLDDRSDIPWNSMNKKDQKQYKEMLGYKIASKLIGKSPSEWDTLSISEKNSGMKELDKHYEFDTKRKQYIERDKPVSSNLMNRLNNISKGFGSWLGNAIKTVATTTSRYN